MITIFRSWCCSKGNWIATSHNLEKFLLAEKIPNPEGNLWVHPRWIGRTWCIRETSSIRVSCISWAKSFNKVQIAKNNFFHSLLSIVIQRNKIAMASCHKMRFARKRMKKWNGFLSNSPKDARLSRAVDIAGSVLVEIMSRCAES